MEALIAEFGLPIALVIYFIWRDSKRDKDDRQDKLALSARIAEVEDYQKDKLEGLATASTEAIMRIDKSNERLVKSTEQVHTALLSRPCLVDSVTGNVGGGG